MSTTLPNRSLAVEIRAARLGYAVFESPKRLRDFGAHLFRSSRAARRRIARLLQFYRPSVLVLHGAGTRYPRDMRSRKVIARIARDEALKLGIVVERVSERAFKSFFEQHSCTDKYDIATLLAKWLPELAGRVPPTPNFYDPEPRQMIYFDSIALAVAYLELGNKAQPTQPTSGTLSPASK